MKALFVSCFLIVCLSKSFCQNSLYNKPVTDSIRMAYFREVCLNGYPSEVFLKTDFVSSKGKKLSAMVQKGELMEYYETKYGIGIDSINRILEKQVMGKMQYPMQDTLLVTRFFKAAQINLDLLNILKKMTVEEVRKKYFDWGGVIKPAYFDKRFLLAGYLFDKCFALEYINSFTPRIDFITTKKIFDVD